MPDLAARISRFAALDLESYLNNTIQRYDKALVETERYTTAKIGHEIDTELLSAFLLNSDALLNILNTYEESYRVVSGMVDLSKELSRCHMSGNAEKDVFVDKKLVERFRRVLKDFGDDAGVFATEGRYLVHFDVLREKSGCECILVLTNDVLLIGAVQAGARKYKLLNAYSYSIARVQANGDVLEVGVEPTTYVFRKDKKSIEHILRVYQELTYNYKKSAAGDVREPEADGDLAEYLVFTEQYEEIEARGLCHPREILFHDRDDMARYLSAVSKAGGEPSPCVFSFLGRRFAEGLGRVNKIQPLGDFIGDVFGFFREFLDEQDVLVKDMSRVADIRRGGLTLLIEKQLTMCLEALESRVFGRGYEMKYTDSVLALVEKNLRFPGHDFSYLMDYFLRKRSGYKQKRLQSAMGDIEKILKDMVPG